LRCGSFRGNQAYIVGQREPDEDGSVGRYPIPQRQTKNFATVRLSDFERCVEVQVEQLLGGPLRYGLASNEGT
jgi:hypothetical protein